MTHVQTSVYHVTGGTDEVHRRADVDLFPILRQQAGFIAYDLIQSEDRVAVTSTWRTREQAEAADRQAVSWVRENFTALAVQLEEQSVAPLAAVGMAPVRTTVSTSGQPEEEWGN